MSAKKSSSDYEKGKQYTLKIDQIQTDPNQPRKNFNEEKLAELTASVKRQGILLPIIFRKGEKGEIILVSGERRVRAAKEAGEKEIQGVFNDGDPAEIALVENLLREDLNPIEEAEAMKVLKDKHDCKDEYLAEMIGKGRSTITEILSLIHLPEVIRDECRANPRYARRELKKIASGKKSEKTMIREFKQLKKRLDQKEEKKGQRNPHRKKIDIISEATSNLTKKFESAYSKMDEQEKEMAVAELENLRKNIGKLIKKYKKDE